MDNGPTVFCHSAVDDFGFSPAQFRVLHHLARRCWGVGSGWPGVRRIAQCCQLSTRAVVDAVRCLEEHGIIRAERKKGRSTVYAIEPWIKWQPYADCVHHCTHSDNTGVHNQRTGCTQSAYKRSTKEGNPFKEYGCGPDFVYRPGEPIPSSILKGWFEDLQKNGAGWLPEVYELAFGEFQARKWQQFRAGGDPRSILAAVCNRLARGARGDYGKKNVGEEWQAAKNGREFPETFEVPEVVM